MNEIKENLNENQANNVKAAREDRVGKEREENSNSSDKSEYMRAANAMDLFMWEAGASSVYWKPDGANLYENVKNFILKRHMERDYELVRSPMGVSASLFEQSGHSEKYGHQIFKMSESMSLKPMSCPNHIAIYKSKINSYQNMPVKFFEFGDVFRDEPSGSLQILFRQRQFCQDDSHIFARPDQVMDLISDYLAMSASAYKALGFEEIKYCVSLRPDKRFGSDELWDRAEEILIEACRSNGIESPVIQENSGAFYGPKIELQVKDKLGRWWQLGVVQLDYVLADRFGLFYIDEKGEKVQPIILHQAVLGSLERMIGVLLESFGINLPESLAPIHSVVLSVSDKSSEYAAIVAKQLKQKLNLNYSQKIIHDKQSNSLSHKIMHWAKKGVSHIYIVGEKEAGQYSEDGIMRASLKLKKGQKNVVI